jgi:hypothetical protein
VNPKKRDTKKEVIISSERIERKNFIIAVYQYTFSSGDRSWHGMLNT